MIAYWPLWNTSSFAQDETCRPTNTDHALGEGYRVIVMACNEEDYEEISLKIIDALGDQIQTLHFPDVTSSAAVVLMNVTHGPVTDIYVPEASGNANTAFSLWSFDAGKGLYARILESSGTDLTRDASGLIVNESRGSCCSWVYDFYRWIPSEFRLAKVGQIESVAQDIDEESGKAGSVVCRVKFGADPVTGMDRPSTILVHHYCSEYGEGFQLEWSSANF